ncbi:MAG: selenocysteine-specific translation elongation factor [Deltaproteobacteria bacterium]|nr:selenocysteine-specific translation elongation factor [Deltaproteobacteria bacterium]
MLKPKQTFIIGTAGHIDHGKTSLIKALTGIDTDRLKEEKERGISIDLGFAYFDLPDGTRCGIVDVPGHERFIKNMLAGAGGFDLVLFVVAADDGIMPQTREHLEIMHLLRVQKGIFVITKIDLADKDRVDEVKKGIKALIENTCLRNSPVVQFSAATSYGLDEIRKKIADIAKDITPKSEGGFFRLPIDRSFAVKGFGAVVTGTAASGRIKKGDDVLILPSGKKAKIRGLQSHKKDVEELGAGQRGAVNLTGVSYSDIKRGDFLVSTDLTKGTMEADVEFEFLSSIEKPVKNHSVLKLHHLTGEALAKVRFLGKDAAAPPPILPPQVGEEKGGGNKIKTGDKVFGRIKLKTPLVMLRNDRFVLRDFSINKTIGGGRVLLPFGLAKPDLEKYQILKQDNLLNIMTLLLSGKDFGLDRQIIRMQMNLTDDALSWLIVKSGVMQFGYFLVLESRIKDLKQSLINSLDTFHKTKPDEIGIEENILSKGLGYKILPAIFKQILDEMILDNSIERDKGFIFLKAHKTRFNETKNPLEQEILNVFKSNGFNPSRLDEVKQKYKGWDFQKTFDILIKKGMIARVAQDVYLSKDTLDMAREKLVGFIDKNNKIKAAEFRDILSCGRKLAIEILEYFDKERFTLRSGDYRVLRKTVKT